MTNGNIQSGVHAVEPTVTVYRPEEKVNRAIASLRKQQKIINWAMVAVVSVVSLGFIAVVTGVFAIFIDHQDYAAQQFSQFVEQLEQYKR